MTGKKEKKFISYFQSVQTVGIITYAENMKQAEKKALDKFKKRDGFIENCIYDQTVYEMTDTEEWTPEIETSYTENGLGWKFMPSEKTRMAIADKLGKNIDQLTDDDFTNFIKSSLEKAIK